MLLFLCNQRSVFACFCESQRNVCFDHSVTFLEWIFAGGGDGGVGSRGAPEGSLPASCAVGGGALLKPPHCSAVSPSPETGGVLHPGLGCDCSGCLCRGIFLSQQDSGYWGCSAVLLLSWEPQLHL